MPNRSFNTTKRILILFYVPNNVNMFYVYVGTRIVFGIYSSNYFDWLYPVKDLIRNKIIIQ